MLKSWSTVLGLETLTDREKFVRSFSIIFLLVLLISLPLLGSGVHYRDDNLRIVNGEVDYWVNNGRPLAVALAWGLHLSPIVSDTSPMFLVIGLAALTAVLCLSMGRLSGVSAPFVMWLSYTIIISPFSVQTMLYTFDSLPILLSVGCGILACVKLSQRWQVQFVFSLILVLSAVLLYQSAVNHSLIMFGLALVLAVDKGEIQGRNDASLLMAMLCGLLSALVIYKLLAPYILTDAWNMSRSISVSLDARGLVQVNENAKAMLATISKAFPGYAGIVVVLIFTVGTLGCWKLALSKLSNLPAGVGRYFASSILFVAPVYVACAIGGFLLVLKNVEFYPRVLTALSSAVVFNICIAHRAWPRLRLPFHALLGVYLLFCTVFAFSAFRAVVNQATFDNSLAGSIRDDLSRLSGKSIRMVSLIGASPLAPSTLPARRHYPILEDILFPALKENEWFEYSGLMGQFLVNYPLGLATPALKAYVPEQVISSSSVYRLYRYKDAAVIDFDTPAHTYTLPLKILVLDPDAPPDAYGDTISAPSTPQT